MSSRALDELDGFPLYVLSAKPSDDNGVRAAFTLASESDPGNAPKHYFGFGGLAYDIPVKTAEKKDKYLGPRSICSSKTMTSMTRNSSAIADCSKKKNRVHRTAARTGPRSSSTMMKTRMIRMIEREEKDLNDDGGGDVPDPAKRSKDEKRRASLKSSCTSASGFPGKRSTTTGSAACCRPLRRWTKVSGSAARPCPAYVFCHCGSGRTRRIIGALWPDSPGRAAQSRDRPSWKHQRRSDLPEEGRRAAGLFRPRFGGNARGPVVVQGARRVRSRRQTKRSAPFAGSQIGKGKEEETDDEFIGPLKEILSDWVEVPISEKDKDKKRTEDSQDTARWRTKGQVLNLGRLSFPARRRQLRHAGHPAYNQKGERGELVLIPIDRRAGALYVKNIGIGLKGVENLELNKGLSDDAQIAISVTGGLRTPVFELGLIGAKLTIPFKKPNKFQFGLDGLDLSLDVVESSSRAAF